MGNGSKSSITLNTPRESEWVGRFNTRKLLNWVMGEEQVQVQGQAYTFQLKRVHRKLEFTVGGLG
jgi:hypothetical protein